MTAPIVLTVKRYQCPHCHRYTRSSKTATVRHIGRCWHNPAVRSCKTCTHFRPASDACGCEPGCNWGNGGEGLPESCAAGVDLNADGAKPGPVVGCPEWTPTPKTERS